MLIAIGKTRGMYSETCSSDMGKIAAMRRACGSTGTTPTFACASLAAASRCRLASARASWLSQAGPRGSPTRYLRNE